MRIFDHPAQLLIIVVLLVLLFGYKRLPDAARGLGKSLRIFKTEVEEMKNDGKPEPKKDAAPLEGRVVEEPTSTPSDQRRDVV